MTDARRNRSPGSAGFSVLGYDWRWLVSDLQRPRLARGFSVPGKRLVLAELPRSQVHQVGGPLAIANGRLVIRAGLTGSCYMSFR